MEKDFIIKVNGWVKCLLPFYLFTLLPLSAQTLDECQQAA